MSDRPPFGASLSPAFAARIHPGGEAGRSKPGRTNLYQSTNRGLNDRESAHIVMTMHARKRILIVEDDRALARVLRDNLTIDGFEVEWVANGNLAEARINALNPDLVVLDITLPGR